MISALTLDQPTRRIELVGQGGGFQGDVETIQFGVLRFKGFLSFLLGHAAVLAEHPVVPGSHGQEHGSIAQVLWSDAGLCFPILPKGGLFDGEGLGRRFSLKVFNLVRREPVLAVGDATPFSMVRPWLDSIDFFQSAGDSSLHVSASNLK